MDVVVIDSEQVGPEGCAKVVEGAWVSVQLNEHEYGSNSHEGKHNKTDDTGPTAVSDK